MKIAVGFGHAWERTSHAASAFAVVHEDGRIERTYNIGDSTGEHQLGDGHVTNPVRLKELADLIELAVEDGKRELAYRLARRRQTEVESLQYAFLVTVGRGGHTIYQDEEPGCESQLQGYGLSPDELLEIARLQIPFVNTTTIPDKRAMLMLRLPMWPAKPGKFDSPPWGGMSFAPIEVIAWLYMKLGATVAHIVMRPPAPGELRDMTLGERTALKGWVSGQESMVAEGMMLCHMERD